MSFLFRSCLLACVAAIALTACGNKGDLVMPTKKPAAPTPTTPATPTTDSPQKPSTSP